MSSLVNLAKSTFKPLVRGGRRLRSTVSPSNPKVDPKLGIPIREEVSLTPAKDVTPTAGSKEEPAEPSTRTTKSGVSFTLNEQDGSYDLKLPTGYQVTKDGEGKVTGTDPQGRPVKTPGESFDKWTASNILNFEGASGERHQVNLRSLEMKVGTPDRKFEQVLESDGSQRVSVLVPEKVDGESKLWLNESAFRADGSETDDVFGGQGDLSFPNRETVMHPTEGGGRGMKKLFFPLPEGARSKRVSEPAQQDGWLIKT